MRTLLCALAVTLISCTSGVMAPPSGLPVTLATTVVGIGPASATLTAAGDSATAIVIQAPSCAALPSADAGIRGGGLVVTLTLTQSRPIGCAVVAGSERFAMVVHQVPAGQYAASVVERSVVGTTAKDTTLLTTTVSLP